MSGNTRTKRHMPSLLAALVCLAAAGAAFASGREDQRSGAILLRSSLPLHFEANQGQVYPEVKFLARGQGYTLYLTPSEAVLVLSKAAADGSPAPSDVVRMKLVGANPKLEVSAEDPLPGQSNYLKGSDRAAWQLGVPHFSRVVYRGVYPGVDLVHYGREGQLEYDFVVAPGADPSAIRIAFLGAAKLALDKDGNLVVKTRGGELLHKAPVVYQELNGQRQSLRGRFVLKPKNQVAFDVSERDPKLALVIDPVLAYSTYLGGSGTNDWGLAIAVLDSTGEAYVTGRTDSTNFPTQSPAQQFNGGGSDAFVTHFAPDGSLVYSTYLGGSANDFGNGIAVDGTGNAYVTGETVSTNFPVTFGPAYAGGAHDAFAAKLDGSGSLVFARYLGGSAGGSPVADDIGFAIAVDGGGNSYITGSTTSTNFPILNTTQGTTKGAGSGPDAFVTKLDASGNVSYSRYLGGAAGDQGFGIAEDGGSAYVVGTTGSLNFPTTSNAFQTAHVGTGGDAFVSVLDATATLTYSTYFGGSSDDRGLAIAVNPGAGNPFITGRTSSNNFPTKGHVGNPPFQDFLAGATDAFVARIVPSASGPASLFYSTYLGGTGSDIGQGIAVGGFGNTYIVGDTQSLDFPVANAIQPVISPNSAQDAFVARVDEFGSRLQYSTYLGGTGTEFGYGIAVDNSANVYVSGRTNAGNFPTSSPVQATRKAGVDAFVARIPFIEVTSPSTNDMLGTGTTRFITWDTSLPFSETLDIELDEGSGFFPIGTATATDYSFPWIVSATSTPETARIRVSWNHGTPAYPFIHYITGDFTIDVPTITVIKPTAGQVFTTGQNKPVTWQHNLGPNKCFHIEVDRDGDTFFDEDIAFPACYSPGFQNSFTWTVTPGVTSTAAVIRVTECVNGITCTIPGTVGDSPAFTLQ